MERTAREKAAAHVAYERYILKTRKPKKRSKTRHPSYGALDSELERSLSRVGKRTK